MSSQRSKQIKVDGPCVYLIHFSHPYQHAGHYLGWTKNLTARLRDHQNGNGARLIAVVREAGIDIQLVRIWHGQRDIEQLLKKYKHSSWLCPICNPHAATHKPLSGISQIIVK